MDKPAKAQSHGCIVSCTSPWGLAECKYVVRGVVIPAPYNPLSVGHPVPDSLGLVVVDGPDLETPETWQLFSDMSRWNGVA